MMLPHELLAYYWSRQSNKFYKLYMGTTGTAVDARGALEEFWASVDAMGDPHWINTQ